MKFILTVCVVVSVAVFTTGFPSETEYDFEIDTFDNSISEEQMQCIKDGVQKVIDDNPELKWWFDELQKSVEKLVAAAKKCESLTGLEQKKCILKVKIATKIELHRLIKLLPADQQKVLETLKAVIKGCLE